MSFHPKMDYASGSHRSMRLQPVDDGMPFEYTAENRARLEEIAKRYPADRRRSAILPALYLLQRQKGFITLNAIEHVAHVIGCSAADVEDVVSFYTMYYTRPMGRYVLQVCRTLPCALRGAERVTEELSSALGIDVGETDVTGTFSLREVECLGACDRAPVVMVNDAWHECLAPESARALVNALRTHGEAAVSGCHLAPAAAATSESASRGAAASGGGAPRALREDDRTLPVLIPFVRHPNGFTLEFYLERQRGYQGLRQALAMTPDHVIETVKASGLRGRGGAGFPTGMKWQFLDKKTDKPRYIACNADESEPGTFKDHLLMERNPHLLIEGCLIGCYAVGAKVAYIYIRGEFLHVQEVLERAIDEACKAAYIGRNIFGTGFDCDIYIHRGAGAYEAGEETALLESLEGKRAQPRLKPPFPASWGLYGCPTAVNNVETLCNVPLIFLNGVEWYTALGPDKNRGPKLFCISGHVARPAVYEATMGTTLRQLIDDYAGGVRDGRRLKAVIPGGSSVPILLPHQLDVEASFDGIQKAGSLLGSAAILVMDDSTCMVWAALNLLHFYRHESCGKCTPCREGTDWLFKILRKIERGEGEMKDISLLEEVAGLITGKTLCPFGDAAATPVLTTVKIFRDEFEAHVREGRCPLDAPWRARHLIASH